MSATSGKWSDENSADGGSEADWELETGNEELYRTRPRQHGVFAKLRSLLPGAPAMSKLNPSTPDSSGNENQEDGIGPSVARWQRTARPQSKTWVRWVFWRIPIIVLCCFGILHIILASFARKSAFWDRPVYAPNWGKPGNPGEGLADYPTDATRDVLPIPCHSHNDYWRRIPLFEAISWGCTGVEADVWLMNGEKDLLVGHSSSSLTRNRTFQSLYVNPIADLLDKMNPTTDFATTTGHGIFDEDPDQTLVLLVDFKTNGDKLFPIVSQQLEPLRERGHLTHWNGTAVVSRAVTVVGTGNAPFDLIVANTTYRDIFFDAPIDLFYDAADSPTTLSRLSRRGQGSSGTSNTTPDSFNSSNSYYASTSFDASIGLPYGELSARQLDLLRGQIKGAHDRGLKARYWETPAWPTSLRNHVWDVLVSEGADMLNVDDLEAAAKQDWTKRVGHGWYDA